MEMSISLWDICRKRKSMNYVILKESNSKSGFFRDSELILKRVQKDRVLEYHSKRIKIIY